MAELIFVQSKSHAGQTLSAVHQDLAGETELKFSENISPDIDVLFLCVGHGEARKFLQENKVNPEIRLIDLSQDFRLESDNRFPGAGKPFVYGLPELNRKEILTCSKYCQSRMFCNNHRIRPSTAGSTGMANRSLLYRYYRFHWRRTGFKSHFAFFMAGK